MANVIQYDLDVLASNPTEINEIAERLKQPSAKLFDWVAQRNYAFGKLGRDDWGLPSEKYDGLIANLEKQASKEFADDPSARSAHVNLDSLRELVEFKAVTNLGYFDRRLNKARRFRNSFKDKYTGIVDSHLYEISEKFPAAVFLLERYDMQSSYSGKRVIHAGKLIREVFDGHQRAQAIDWVLLDIFAPYCAEYERELEFGSLWDQWTTEVLAAAHSLGEEKEVTLAP